MISTKQLGPGCWKGFMKWNKHHLVRKKGQKYALEWKDHPAYWNMYNMHNEIYKDMTESGVAIEL